MMIKTLYLFLAGLFIHCNPAVSSDFLFETGNLEVKLLQSQHFDEIKKVQDTNEVTYLSSAMDEEVRQSLRAQDGYSNSTLVKALEEIGAVGIGLFSKSDQGLIGMGTLNVHQTVIGENSEERAVKPSLETSLRILKEKRGKGFGTEYKYGLVTYLTNNDLIPTHQAGPSAKTPYRGLSALVHFHNKPSLKASKGGFFELLGYNVYVYYPRNVGAEKERDGDENLDSLFARYLSNDVEVSESGKRDLIFYSLKRYARGKNPLKTEDGIEMSMTPVPYEETSSSVAFVVNALHDFPEVFEKLSDSEQKYFKEKFITESSRDFLKRSQDLLEEAQEVQEVQRAEKNLCALLNLEN